MFRLSAFRTALFATVALAGLAGPATAQTVQMFDEAPPLEVLRGIMVPESTGGLTRRIVIPRPDITNSAVQPAAMSNPMPATQPSAAQPFATPATPAAARPMPTAAPTAPAVQPAAPASEPAAAPATHAKPGIVGFRVNFAFDSDALAPAYRTFVERIGQLMQEEPQVRIRIEGYTDAVGSDSYNRDLSERRGLAVAKYLVQHMGVDAERLTIVGKGKSEPLVADPFDPANRRVQFVRVD